MKWSVSFWWECNWHIDCFYFRTDAEMNYHRTWFAVHDLCPAGYTVYYGTTTAMKVYAIHLLCSCVCSAVLPSETNEAICKEGYTCLRNTPFVIKCTSLLYCSSSTNIRLLLLTQNTVQKWWHLPCINLLKTKRNLPYIRNQSVPRSKHIPPRL